jgi:RNA recognition motif-containing protein
VFLRNIPFDATPESLKMAFHDYAPVAFAIIVKDRATSMSKGTAFVKFKVHKTRKNLAESMSISTHPFFLNISNTTECPRHGHCPGCCGCGRGIPNLVGT